MTCKSHLKTKRGCQEAQCREQTKPPASLNSRRIRRELNLLLMGEVDFSRWTTGKETFQAEGTAYAKSRRCEKSVSSCSSSWRKQNFRAFFKNSIFHRFGVLCLRNWSGLCLENWLGFSLVPTTLLPELEMEDPKRI